MKASAVVKVMCELTLHVDAGWEAHTQVAQIYVEARRVSTQKLQEVLQGTGIEAKVTDQIQIILTREA